MATVYWGVDSANPATFRVAYAKGHPTLFDYVTETCGRMPDFWGRYIGGSYKLTEEEVGYISHASKGKCRILVIYNGAHNAKTSTQGGKAEGLHDAQKAVAAATKLGVPPGTMIFCDIEPGWKCTADWFRGWWEGMYASLYAGAGGMYENPLPWNAPNFSSPYLKALTADAASPVQSFLGSRRYLYSQQPQKGFVPPKSDKFASLAFAPAEPAGLAGETVLWQYAINCLKLGDSKIGLIDMNLADQRGYDLMWAGSIPAATPVDAAAAVSTAATQVFSKIGWPL